MAHLGLQEQPAVRASRPAAGLLQVLAVAGLLLISAASLGLLSPAAQAGNRYSDCGGVGQRACCAFPEFRLPSCDSGLTEYLGGPGAGQGPLSCSAGTCYTTTFPAQCGRKDQRACTIFEFIPSCQSGLVERLYQGTSYCREIDSDGYPTICGGTGERPCVISEKTPSCKAGNYEYPLGANCQALDSDGYPAFCGDDLEAPCTLDLQVLLGVTSCKAGLQEVGFPSGICYALDSDGYPASCGSAGEPGCTIDLQIAFGITSCKPGLTESPSIGGTCYVTDSDGYPGGCGDLGEPPCDIAVQLLNNIKSCKAPYFETPKLNPVRLECDTCQSGDPRCLFGGEIDFIRPVPQFWPNDEAAAGERSIFLIHGLGSSASNAFRRQVGDLPSVLDDPAIGHDVYAVDYNAGNGNGSTPNPLRIFRFKRLDAADGSGNWGEWDLVYTHPGKPLDGTNFTVFEVAAFIADGIEELETAGNISIVAHSLGGIMARHLVYRHYDELRNAGKRIAEVVTFGTPHQGGGVGLPFIPAGSGLQEIVGCAGILLESDPERRRLLWQLCQLERWQKGRQIVAAAGAPIDDFDYPQIHWATVAGAGNLLNFFNSDLPALDSDKVVAVISAHGIKSDQCFPHLHDEFLPGINVVPGVTRDVNGFPALSADCYQPDHIGNEDPNYAHVTELIDPGSGEPRDHSGILVDRDAICFTKSVVAKGLIDADADGDGIPYCRDNCTAVANSDQRDTDGDGYGNQCDADFNNDGVVNFADLASFRARFGSTDPDADLNGDGAVNFADLAIFRSLFGQPPGPSGTAP